MPNLWLPKIGLAPSRDPELGRFPIVIAGSSGLWKEDTTNPTKRITETDSYQAAFVAIDRHKRWQRGTRTFHIKNNPLKG